MIISKRLCMNDFLSIRSKLYYQYNDFILMVQSNYVFVMEMKLIFYVKKIFFISRIKLSKAYTQIKRVELPSKLSFFGRFLVS